MGGLLMNYEKDRFFYDIVIMFLKQNLNPLKVSQINIPEVAKGTGSVSEAVFVHTNPRNFHHGSVRA